jgi:hypothetical protein
VDELHDVAFVDCLTVSRHDARLRHANGRRRADWHFRAWPLEARYDAMSYDNDYFRRKLQAFVDPIGRFNGQVQVAINGGRLCKLEFLHRAKFQCIHQGQDKWSQEIGTLVLSFAGTEKTARKSFEKPLREREGDYAELVANFSDGQLDDFFYIGKAR